MTEPMTHFDLISDLHLTETSNFTWRDKATSLFCIVAGNIAEDRNVLYDFLDEIKEHYEVVFFLDGELEHKCYNGNMAASYRNLINGIDMIDNVFFLHENIIIVDDTTLVGANGWTTFDFSNKSTVDQTMTFLSDKGILNEYCAGEIFKLAITDQVYMKNSIETCQTLDECEKIVIVTSSVPKFSFISHNDDYDGTVLGDLMGNNGIDKCLEQDLHTKVKTWAFGKFPEDLDYKIDNIRYVNNPGRNRDMSLYFPKRIEV